MRSGLFAFFFALAGLAPPSADAAGLGSERRTLHLLSDVGAAAPEAARAPSALQKVGFFGLGVAASMGSLFLASPVVSGLQLEGISATIVGSVVVLGVSALAHYGLAVLLGIPVSVPSVLVGVAGGAAAGLLTVLAVVAVSEPQSGLAGLGTAFLALAAGALAYGVVSPLLVLVDPLGLSPSAPSTRARLHSQAKGPPRSRPMPQGLAVPFFARSF